MGLKVFTTPSVPLTGDRKTQGREDVTALQWYIFENPPSLFTLKEGSTSHPDPLSLRGEGGNRPTRCSEPLRSKDGGASKPSPNCAGWDRLGIWLMVW